MQNCKILNSDTLAILNIKSHCCKRCDCVWWKECRRESNPERLCKNRQVGEYWNLVDMEVSRTINVKCNWPIWHYWGKQVAEDYQNVNLYNTAKENWKKKDVKAQKIVVTALGKEPTLHLMRCTDAYEIWKQLHSIYEQKSSTAIHLSSRTFIWFCETISRLDGNTYIKTSKYSSTIKRSWRGYFRFNGNDQNFVSARNS